MSPVSPGEQVGTSNASEPFLKPLAGDSITDDTEAMQQRLNLAAANGQNPHPIRGEGELLPCPFCGHDGEVRQTHDEFSRRRAIVVCRGCDASSEPSIGEARAIAAWNRRAHPPTSYEGEGLREALEVAAVQLQLAGGWLRESGDDGQRANTLLNASNKAREALQSASEK